MRTLVVDDDAVVAQLHAAFVGAVPGFAVVGLAHTGARALAVARARPVDLVLLDIHLPDTTGIEVLRQLRELPRDAADPVDVFAITAAREVETVRQALAGGVVDYLVKPFTAADLRARLTGYLERRRLLTPAGGPARRGLDQGAVDRARAVAARTPAPPGAAVRPPPPKGLAAATLELVADALRSCEGGLSATEVAARVGVSRVSARRYLEHLVRRGDAVVAPRYGGVGRPENGYRAVRPPAR